MWEFEMLNKITGEVESFFGRNIDDMFHRHPKLNPNEWICLLMDYND